MSASKFPSIIFHSGFSIETFPSKRSPRLSVLFDLGLRYYSTSNSVNFNSLAAGNGTQFYYFRFSHLKFSPYIRTTLNSLASKSKVFVTAGLSVSYLLDCQSSYELTSFINGNPIVVTAAALTGEDISKSEFAAFIGTGLKVNRFTFETRGEVGTGVLQNFQSLSSSTYCFSLIAGYKIR